MNSPPSNPPVAVEQIVRGLTEIMRGTKGFRAWLQPFLSRSVSSALRPGTICVPLQDVTDAIQAALTPKETETGE